MLNSALKRPADASAARFLSAVTALAGVEDRKTGYDPAQPRVPSGQGRDSGRWAKFMSAVGKLAQHAVNEFADEMAHFGEKLVEPLKPVVVAAMDAAPPEVRKLIRDNQQTIERTLGAVQAIGGGAQIAEGAHLIEAGAATLPEGAPAVVAGALLTARGADDLRTGLRILATGDAQPGAFYSMLRNAGLDDNAAQLALASTSGIPAIAAAHIPTDILQRAADSALKRDSLATLLSKGKVLTADGSRLFDQADIAVRGELTELDALAQNGGRRTGPTFKTFDIIITTDDGKFNAISVKSLDARTDRYLQADPETMFPRMKKMIDDVMKFDQTNGHYRDGGPLTLRSDNIASRGVDLYLPAGTLIKGQTAQVEVARAYAAKNGVRLAVRYVH